MIYLDATHGTNIYGFHLTNIVIAGRHGTLAVAHMVSDMLPSWVIERFLHDTVRTHGVAPRYAVTDDDNAEFKVSIVRVRVQRTEGRARGMRACACVCL